MCRVCQFDTCSCMSLPAGLRAPVSCTVPVPRVRVANCTAKAAPGVPLGNSAAWTFRTPKFVSPHKSLAMRTAFVMFEKPSPTPPIAPASAGPLSRIHVTGSAPGILYATAITTELAAQTQTRSHLPAAADLARRPAVAPPSAGLGCTAPSKRLPAACHITTPTQQSRRLLLQLPLLLLPLLLLPTLLLLPPLLLQPPQPWASSPARCWWSRRW